jgi:MT0933-like antitoxin protein
MSGLGEYAQKAEKYAEDNPDKVDQAVQRGEQFADQQTGNRYDQQVGQIGQDIEHHVDGNQQSQQDQGQQDQGQQDQDQYGQGQGQQYGGQDQSGQGQDQQYGGQDQDQDQDQDQGQYGQN